MTALHRFIPAAALVFVAACAPGATMDGSADPEVKSATPASVTVRNNNWLDLVIYVVNGTQRQRLGTVTALSTGSFRIPSVAMGNGQVRLYADPIGSNEGFLTETVTVQPGQRLALDVGQNLSISFLAVRF
jgi:hypothetical protein